MIITFYNSETGDHFEIRPSFAKDSIWLSRGCGEGSEFSSKVVDNIIYKALDEFFKENF